MIQEGLMTKCEIVRIIDGDTMEIQVSRKIHVRLLDAWAAENNTEEGKKVTEAARQIIAAGKEYHLFIPSDDNGNLSHLFTFGRILGCLYIDGKLLSDMLYEIGLIKRTKDDGK